MKNSFVLAVLVSLFSFSHIYSQGIFLEREKPDFFVNGGFSSLESRIYATSFGGGFALGGVMELSFSLVQHPQLKIG
ncbi:MAG: hypothetical protein MZV64_50600 [Ignavibacteriales bacterium]|nr:hypothetical protein [Ignavibacteriales bacterium]